MSRLGRPIFARARVVHLLFGAVLPVAFLFFDPIVFRTSETYVPLGSYLGQFRAFGYIATCLAAMLLIHASIRPAVTAMEAGMLYGAAGVSAALGLALIPITIVGVFVYGIGLLGFSPFVASWIYFTRGAQQHADRRTRLWSPAAAAGALLFVLIAVAGQIAVHQGIDFAIAAVDRPAGRSMLPILRPFVDADQLVHRHDLAPSPDEQRRIAMVYRAMTGRYLEERLAQLD